MQDWYALLMEDFGPAVALLIIVGGFTIWQLKRDLDKSHEGRRQDNREAVEGRREDNRLYTEALNALREDSRRTGDALVELRREVARLGGRDG